MASERELIARIKAMVGTSAADLVTGIGDDCAVLRSATDRVWLVTTDSLADTIHFDRSWHPPLLLGRKAAAVNISDVAAMGGRPCFALLAMAVADDLRGAWLDAFIEGFVGRLADYDTILVGGDTVACSQGAVFTVTLIGQARADQVCYRKAAREGDSIWVSGSLGGAAAGLELCRRGEKGLPSQWQELVRAHLDPEPRVRLGTYLATSGKVGAMLDLSDGLATDLAHICAASRKGAVVDAGLLPAPEDLADVAGELGRDPLEWMISGGEDYQLLFTAPAEHDQTLAHEVHEQTGTPVRRIGRIVAGSGVVLRTGSGNRRIDFQGFEHFSPCK